MEPWWEGTPQPGPDPQQLLDTPSPAPGPQPRAHVSVTHLAAGVAVVAPQGEGEIAAAVHAHHDVRDGHEGWGPLPQADPQPLPHLEQRSQAGSGVRRPAGPEPPVLWGGGVCVYGRGGLDSTLQRPPRPRPAASRAPTSVRNRGEDAVVPWWEEMPILAGARGRRDARSPPRCAGRRPAPGPCSPRAGPGSRSCATHPSLRRSCGHKPD